MKIVKRPAGERGRTTLDWLDSRHTFSFGDYYDRAHMGFRALRVLNDDIVEPGQGFGRHAHRDAEILSYVLEGRLEHKDSLGNGRVVERGDVQYMSAGTGVQHSEFNPSRTERVHFLQIWIMPNEHGKAPRYADKRIATDARPNAMTLLFSGEPRDGAIAIRADADVYIGRLETGARIDHALGAKRGAWIHVVDGNVAIGGESLAPGDGAAIEDATTFTIESARGAELLVFDLA